jgi:hypothetical protein
MSIPFLARLRNQAVDQVVSALGAFPVDYATERVLPFLGFLRVGIGGAGRQRVFSGRAAMNLSPGLQNHEMNSLAGRQSGRQHGG